MDEAKFNVEQEITDVLIGRQYGFVVGGESFRLYPVTLAKKLVLQDKIGQLAIDMGILKKNLHLEALRLATESKAAVCDILSLHATPNSREAFFDTEASEARRDFFAANMATEDIAAMFVVTLTSDKTDTLISHLGLDKERERLEKVMAIKNRRSKNNKSFGGKSLFGAFIGQLKEMGYTDDDILFKHGYTYLRLMLADKITSVYLSDEELEDLPTTEGGTLLDGGDPASKAAFMAQLKKSGVEI